MKVGRKKIGSGQHKFCINLYPYEWDKIKEFSKNENKTASTWCAEKLVNWFSNHKFDAPKEVERDKAMEDSSPRQLVCPLELFQLLKKGANVNDMSTSKYFVNIIFG